MREELLARRKEHILFSRRFALFGIECRAAFGKHVRSVFNRLSFEVENFRVAVAVEIQRIIEIKSVIVTEIHVFLKAVFPYDVGSGLVLYFIITGFKELARRVVRLYDEHGFRFVPGEPCVIGNSLSAVVIGGRAVAVARDRADFFPVFIHHREIENNLGPCDAIYGIGLLRLLIGYLRETEIRFLSVRGRKGIIFRFFVIRIGAGRLRLSLIERRETPASTRILLVSSVPSERL